MVVSNSLGSVISSAANVSVYVDAHLVNLSARAFTGNGPQALVTGFVVNGQSSKKILIRAVGPTLSQFSVGGALANPQLTLFDNTESSIATNMGWGNASSIGPSSVPSSVQRATSAIFNDVYAFPLSSGSADCAMLATLPPAVYTAEVSGVSDATGVALAELYDADTGTPAAHLINASARAFVSTGSRVLVAGFVISGTTSETILIRGIGPTLSQFGVSGVLAVPQLTLFDSSNSVIATNTGWSNSPNLGQSTVQVGIQVATSSVMRSVYAFSLPAGSTDCAMVVTLPPGAYTAQVSGVNGSTGVALAEVYDIP